MNNMAAIGTSLFAALLAFQLFGLLVIHPIVFALIVSFVVLDVAIGRLILAHRKKKEERLKQEQ